MGTKADFIEEYRQLVAISPKPARKRRRLEALISGGQEQYAEIDANAGQVYSPGERARLLEELAVRLEAAREVLTEVA